MKQNRKLIVALSLTFVFISLAMISPLNAAAGYRFAEDRIREEIRQKVNSYPLNFRNDQESAKQILANIEKDYSRSSLATPFSYLDTFNFTNSNNTFGNLIMTEEEVSSNIRNYMHQLLYGDLQAACEISVLDVMLLRAFDSIIIDWIKMDFAGFCNGFAQASRDYFLDPALIPLGKDHTWLLPSPHPNETISEARSGDVVEAAIKEYVLWKGSGAFFNPNHLLNWMTLYLGIPLHEGGTNNGKEFEELTQLMLKDSPHYSPVVLLVTAPVWEVPEPTESHFVVAYDYETNTNGSHTIYIYDNNDRYTSNSDIYDDWILLQADGSFKGSHHRPEANWTRMSAYEQTAEYNTILGALIELLPKLAQFTVLSPVDVTITDPLGRTIGPDEDGNMQTEFPAIYKEKDGHKYILMPYTSGLPYQVNLTGTGSGDYTMEVNRVVNGGLANKTITGFTEPGQVDLYSVTLESGGGDIDIAEQGIKLYKPTILSGSAVRLNWSKYRGQGFQHYEIRVAQNISSSGEVYSIIEDQDVTERVISDLTPKKTYFFTIRVVTDGTDRVSNRVGAVMPADTTWMLWVAAAAGGAVVLLIILVLIRRRRSK